MRRLDDSKITSMGLGLGLILVLCTLAGCDSADHEELSQWMAEQRKATHPRVPPLPVPVQFTPATYDQSGAIDPFSNQKLTQALQSSQKETRNAALIAPELTRQKEPLESSPLDAVMMVGSLIKSGQPVALIRVDNLIYQVKVGNYLGQNYGRITQITESTLVLREIVQDPSGEWTERVATLHLSEEAKK